LHAVTVSHARTATVPMLDAGGMGEQCFVT